MRTLTATIATVLALATPAFAATSGLRGVVMRGPVTPVCRAELPCSAPAKDVKLTFTRLGRSWRTTTDDHGRYRIVLKAGTYVVRISTQLPRTTSWRVVVPHGRVAVHDFHVDTGIR
jgi:hypothetical protein